MGTECMYRWFKRYIRGERHPRNSNLIVGSATDKATSADLQMKLETEVLLPEDAVTDVAAQEVTEQYQDEVELSEEEAPLGKQAAQGAAIDKAVRLTRVHHREVAPRIVVRSLHRPWSISLDDFLKSREVGKVEMDYVGEMDIEEVETDPMLAFGVLDERAILAPGEEPNFGESIRDVKTTKATKGPDEAARSIQLTSYALGKQVNDGVMPRAVKLDYLVDLKRGPEWRPQIATRDKFDFASLFNRLETFVRMMKAGIFPPANPNHWRCSQKYCEFYQKCPYTKNPHTVNLTPPDPAAFRLSAIDKARKKAKRVPKFGPPDPFEDYDLEQ
jgi:hypothetical protein